MRFRHTFHAPTWGVKKSVQGASDAISTHFSHVFRKPEIRTGAGPVTGSGAGVGSGRGGRTVPGLRRPLGSPKNGICKEASQRFALPYLGCEKKCARSFPCDFDTLFPPLLGV